MQKVRIYNLKTGTLVIDCTAQFNPDKLKLNKSVKWSTKPTWKSNIGTTTFGGGKPTALSVNLFFDTTATGGDVRDYTTPLMSLTLADISEASQVEDTEVTSTATIKIEQKELEINKKKDDLRKKNDKINSRRGHDSSGPSSSTRGQIEQLENERDDIQYEIDKLELELKELQEGKKEEVKSIEIGLATPPKCRFEWGTFSFICIVKSVNVTFTMFKPDGTPVRARAKVKMTEIEEPDLYQPQNPTTRSAPRKIWVVEEGQTLDWIAYKEFGNAAMWRYLARINNLSNPRDLRPGQVLNL